MSETDDLVKVHGLQPIYRARASEVAQAKRTDMLVSISIMRSDPKFVAALAPIAHIYAELDRQFAVPKRPWWVRLWRRIWRRS